MKFLFEDDWDDFNSVDEEPITEEQTEFADELFNFLQELVNEEDSLVEEFVSKSELNKHFKKHSLAGDTSKNSVRQKIFYDFNYVNDYKQYEDTITQKVNRTNYQIPSLLDNQLIERYFHRLFEGNVSILFPTICGFTNSNGKIMIGIYAYSTGVTTNYLKGNTVTIVVLTPNGKTISMYPVDANYLENKLNNIIKKYSTTKTKLHFNR